MSIQDSISDAAEDVEYFSLSDFDLFDDEEAFKDLCKQLDFDPLTGKNVNESLCAPQDRGVNSADLLDPLPTTSKSSPRGAETMKELGSGNTRKAKSHLRDTEDISADVVTPYRSDEREDLLPREPHKKVKSRSSVERSQPQDRVHTIPMQSTDHLAPAAPRTPAHVLAADDIRFSYATTFINAINQREDALPLDTVLEKYTTESLCCVYKFMGKRSPHNSDFIEVHGRGAVNKYWHAIFAGYPDYFYDLLDTKMKVLVNGFCSITSQFTFAATKVLDLVSDQGNTIIVSDPSKMDEVNGGVSIVAFIVDGENRQVIDGRPPVENTLITGVSAEPKKVSLLGTITYYVNPEKLVYKMEVLYAFRNPEHDV